jgi:hypothetical protein
MHGRTHTWVGPVDTHIAFLSSLDFVTTPSGKLIPDRLGAEHWYKIHD